MEDNNNLTYYSVKRVDSMSYLIGKRYIFIPNQCYDLVMGKVYNLPKKIYEEICPQLNYLAENKYYMAFEPEKEIWIERIRIDMKTVLNND